MRRLVSVIICIVMSLAVTGCKSEKNVPTVERSDLIGQWTKQDYDAFQTITLKEDGTYLSSIQSDYGFSYDSQHTWTYEDGVFTVYYEDLGTTSVYTKVTFDGTVLTLDNGEAQLVLTKK